MNQFLLTVLLSVLIGMVGYQTIALVCDWVRGVLANAEDRRRQVAASIVSHNQHLEFERVTASFRELAEATGSDFIVVPHKDFESYSDFLIQPIRMVQDHQLEVKGISHLIYKKLRIIDGATI